MVSVLRFIRLMSIQMSIDTMYVYCHTIAITLVPVGREATLRFGQPIVEVFQGAPGADMFRPQISSLSAFVLSVTRKQVFVLSIVLSFKQNKKQTNKPQILH